METEKIFYQDQNVTITQSRYIALGKTYAMRNISSVSIYRVERSTLLPMTLFTIGLIMCFDTDVRLAGIILVLGSFVWMATMRSSYSVRISTNSGETNSLTSKNKQYVQEIVSALNDAIVYRG